MLCNIAGAITVVVLRNADVLVIHVVNRVCGRADTSSVLDSVMSRVTDRDVINLVPDF